MAHSIELLFDPDTEAAIRRGWEDLAAAGLPSQGAVTSATNRPHVTLAAADRIDPQVDSLLTPLGRLLPMPCRLGGTLLFGQRKPVLARLVVPSAELLSAHAQVHRLSVGHLMPGPFAHVLPGQWTPHVTLARRIDPELLPRALAVLGGHGGDIDARFVGLRRWDGDNRVDRLIS
jgi:hypothetical protein